MTNIGHFYSKLLLLLPLHSLQSLFRNVSEKEEKNVFLSQILFFLQKKFSI